MTSLAVIPGDGIGPEVIEQALKTLEALGAGLDIDLLDHVNAERYLADGVGLSDMDLDRIRSSDGVLLGAVGDARVAHTDYVRSVLLRLRFELDLYVNHRPAKLLDDRLSPLRDETKRAVDCVVVRENTEGLYAGVGGVLRPQTPFEVTMDAEINTHYGVSRIIDYAFSVARSSVCMIDKSNAVPFGGQLWQRYWREAAARHPDIETSHLYMDAAVMKLVEDPTRYDVIVANNSHGDILSDLTAQLAGGLGTAASANINPASNFGLYEPVHGTAPDIAGRGLANPIGAILSAALMLDRFGHVEWAQAVRRAVATVIERRRVTPDLGGTLCTEDAGAAIRGAL
ncbi:isocitrate/isopropylmalate dehydrogenase family protein [Streptomyces flavidovirens]|uniref:isocitrate/isopropylmalate dehydrogenase family protein n=1 Tax=Streptomyces flavidovirens TaxID=67298 RepID=UPI0034497F67